MNTVFLRSFIANNPFRQISFIGHQISKPCFYLIASKPFHVSSLARFSLIKNVNSLKGTFDSNKKIEEEPQPHEEDEETNFNQIKSSVLQKYLQDEKKYDGKLIYVGGLTSQLKGAKILSLTSSLMGIFLLPFLVNTLSASTLFAQIFVFGSTGFFIFATPILSQILTRRYVSRMYYNYEEKKFKAILFNFLLIQYKLEFTMDDVFMPDMPGIFTTLRVKSSKRNLFVDLNQINDLKITEALLGYDKPFDIKKYQSKPKDEDD